MNIPTKIILTIVCEVLILKHTRPLFKCFIQEVWYGTLRWKAGVIWCIYVLYRSPWSALILLDHIAVARCAHRILWSIRASVACGGPPQMRGPSISHGSLGVHLSRRDDFRTNCNRGKPTMRLDLFDPSAVGMECNVFLVVILLVVDLCCCWWLCCAFSCCSFGSWLAKPF